MIKTDEDALVCDLAETYQIYDYKQLPPTKVAVFSYGLRENSRIKMKMSKQNVSLETSLLAYVADKLATLEWFKTEDGQKGKNRPKSLYAILTGKSQNNEDIDTYKTGEDFIKARQRIISGGE